MVSFWPNTVKSLSLSHHMNAEFLGTNDPTQQTVQLLAKWVIQLLTLQADPHHYLTNYDGKSKAEQTLSWLWEVIVVCECPAVIHGLTMAIVATCYSSAESNSSNMIIHFLPFIFFFHPGDL